MKICYLVGLCMSFLLNSWCFSGGLNIFEVQSWLVCGCTKISCFLASLGLFFFFDTMVVIVKYRPTKVIQVVHKSTHKSLKLIQPFGLQCQHIGSFIHQMEYHYDITFAAVAPFL